MTNRQRLTQVSIQRFLQRVAIPGLDVRRFALSTQHPTTLALAMSGGGYRAFLNGVGFLAALDDRSFNATNEGHLGGLLQGASYIGAISGGSWTLMSVILSDFVPMVKLHHEWDMSEPLLEGVPNLKQMEVSRGEIQVLPARLQDDDRDFYDKLNAQKRHLNDADDDHYDYDVGINAFEDQDENVFYEFYRSLELVPSLDDIDEFPEEEQEQKDDLQLYHRIPEHEGYDGDDQATTASGLIKREETNSDDSDWMENLRAFFKSMFKKKEASTQFSAQKILPNIDFSNELFLKAMKKVFNFYENLHLEVRAKKAAGFPVSFTDYWGRALSRRIFPKNGRTPNTTLSGVMNLKSFKEFQQPFPVIISNLREPGVETTSVNSSLFEFTPYEFGSWDYKMFIKLKYLGSLLHNGEPMFHLKNTSVCYCNFDNAGFITGTSSSLFNNILIYVWQLAASSTRDKFRAIKAVLNTFGLTSTQNGIDPKKHPDYALYTPNPFYRYGDGEHVQLFNSKHLYMVDGGEDGQNIPYQPFVQPSRKVDVIFSFDSTADTQGWPNGTMIQNTYLRYNHSLHAPVTVVVNGMVKNINMFPEIPTPDEFVLKGLNKRPVFFGCFLEKYTQRGDSLPRARDDSKFLPPIIGLFSNREYTYRSNTSTFQLVYEDAEISNMIENAYSVASYGNSTADADYTRCVGCVLIKREFDRKERGMSLVNDMKLPDFCKQCYTRYCYN